MSWYYVWAVLLTLANLAAWVSTLVLLPGNWIVVGLTALFVWLVPAPEGMGIGWSTVAIATVLATLGEIAEFAAGAAGAARRQASRRAILLSLVGAIAGSMIGAVVGLPVPLVGPVLAALLGGGVGAFVGAYFGEQWAGRSHEDSVEVGKAAFVGRMLGTVAKLAIGAAMVAIVTIDAFF